MFLRYFLFSIFLCVSLFVKADIGETFDMLKKREQLVKENEQLLNGRNIDSLSKPENSHYVENLHIIKLLDEDIFKSQETTIKRIGNTSGNNEYVNQSIGIFCFLLALMLAISGYMIYLMNNRLNRFTNEETTFSGRLKELFSVLLVNFKPAPEGKSGVAVNRLIILGMLFMFISFLGYLLKTLGI